MIVSPATGNDSHHFDKVELSLSITYQVLGDESSVLISCWALRFSLTVDYLSFLNGRVNKKWELKHPIFKTCRFFLDQTRLRSFFALICKFMILMAVFSKLLISKLKTNTFLQKC